MKRKVPKVYHIFIKLLSKVNQKMVKYIYTYKGSEKYGISIDERNAL